MIDQERADGNEGEGEYADLWEEAAREEAGQAGEAPQQADDRHDHPGATEAPADQGQPEAKAGERQEPDAARPAGSETDDPWKDAPAPLREAFEAERKEREKAQNLIRANQGRWSKAERELAELRSRQSAPAEPQAEAKAGKEWTSDLDQKLKQVEEDYDQIGKPFGEAIAILRSELAEIKQDASRRTEIEAKQAELDTQERYAREEQALAEAHSDWLEQVRSDAFKDWATQQPPMVWRTLEANTPNIVSSADASKILADFKRDIGIGAPSPLADKRAAQLEGSRQVPARVPAMQARDGSSGSYDDEWKLAAEEEKRAAQRK